MESDEVRRLLCDVEAAQQQTLSAAATEPHLIAELKDPVLFLLDLLCQIDDARDPRAQLEVLDVLHRVFLPCLAFGYDTRVFESTVGASTAPLAAEATAVPTAEPPTRYKRRENVVLKALLAALRALASKTDVRMDVITGVVALVKATCVQSMSAADAVLLFDFLRVGKPPVRQLVLELQTELMTLETAPRAVFTMSGPHGGIVAPASQMLFSKRGYSFSCGVLLDAGSPGALVALYSFRGNSGQGISAVLDGATLVVKTHMQQGNCSQVVVPFADARRQLETAWTHVCIVHAKKMVFKDKLSVYVDGKLVHTGNLVYPDPLCMVGGHNCIGTMPMGPGLQGKLWSPTLFGAALTEAEIEKLHWRTHWKSGLSAIAAENTGLADKSKFAFSYDARSCDAARRVCFDVSGAECHGWLEPGTHACVTQTFAEALDSMGGCACFLLLLLDQIPEMADFHPTHEFAMDEIAQVLAFVAAGLQSSLVCRSHFVRLHGVKVLAFVLQSVSPTYLSLKLLESVTKILEALVDAVPASVAVEAITLLLFQSTSWYLAPFETQAQLLAETLPHYLRIVQAKRATGRPATSSTPSSSTQASAAPTAHQHQHYHQSSGALRRGADALLELETEPDAGDDVNVRFFCNLLVQVYSPHGRESSSVEPMSDVQLEVLRKLVIHNLIDRLLFPVAPDASLDQWRQLVVHIQQRSSRIGATDDVNDSIELKELVRYLTQLLTVDSHVVATSAQLLSPRQLMTTKICKLSEGTLRLWWRPMMAAHDSVRLEALKLFEAYTADKILLRKRDMVMLHASLQGHALTLATADVLLDIVVGRKRRGYLGGSAAAATPSESSGTRTMNIARQDFVPVILLGPLQYAAWDVQAHVLLEVRAQLSSPIAGESIKESIRSWPPWLRHLRGLAACRDTPTEHARELAPWLQEKLAVLTDTTSSASARLEAVREISEAQDDCGALAVAKIFETTEQPASVAKAVTALIRARVPERCDVLVRKLATQAIADIVVYSVLHVRSGWMHALELYFYYYEAPEELCAVSNLVCEQLVAKMRQREVLSFGDSGIFWENVCQVAAILTQCQLLASQPGFERARLSTRQYEALLQRALELWLVVLPHVTQIHWSDMREHLAAHANYGADVTPDDKALFCNVVATSTRARFLALHCSLELVRLAQTHGECTASVVSGLQKVLKSLQLIPHAPVIESHANESVAHAAVKSIARRTRSSSGSQASMMLNASAPRAAAGLSLVDASSVLGAIRDAHASGDAEGEEQRALVHLHVLESCFAFLEHALASSDAFAMALAIVEAMVAVAGRALALLHESSAPPELAKTLQIISSTDLTFFHETSQLRDFFTLWQLHRATHGACCDAALLQARVDALHAPFLERWRQHVAQSPTEFNPFLTLQHAASQADVLSAEVQSCERLWTQIMSDDSASAALRSTTGECDDDSRLSSLKDVVEKFASSVHRLIAPPTTDRGASALSSASDSSSSASGLRRVADGFLYKVDSKENSLRMHLRLKKVRDNYRLRTLSCELAGSTSFQDAESRGSGRLLRPRLRGSRDGAPSVGEREHSWRSDAGSDYSDFLADAQMRAAIIRSCSTVDMQPAAYDVHSDDDDLDGDDDDGGVSASASEEVKDVLAFYAASEDSRESFASHAEPVTALSLSASGAEPLHLEAASSPATSPTTPSASAAASAPSSTSSLSAFSIGASMLSVVGGVAGLVQKAARDAKDAVEFGVDSLYTAKDALTDEAQSLMDEVSTLMEENELGPALGVATSSPSGSPTSRGALATGTVASESPVLFPAPAPVETQSKERDATAAGRGSDRARSLARSTSSKQDVVVSAKLVRHMHIVDGVLVLTDTALHFIPERVIDEHETVLVERTPGERVAAMWRFLFKRRQWRLDDLVSLNRRRYLLKSTALELFVLSTRRNYFFNLSHDDLADFHDALMARRPLLLKRDPAMRRLRHPSSIFRTSSMSARWVNHDISTFEYLMWLNTIAGRTYNDLTQYPIFPWVIADYDSPTLDLARAATFRDLTKPIGALDPTRLKFYLDRYSAFEDSDIPKFMYGTHYSNIGAVLYYLIRLEPYTSYALSVQGGKFDHADRLFHSVAETWRNCLTDFTDVKELTPEWFYLPDFLVNCNGLELGTKQNGVDLGHVVLPPWARSPEDFVLQNLVALESEYVSAHLHHWIDLIFGAKQRGPAAVDAHNVFFYLTYEGMVDIDSIADPVTKSSMRAQIAHFGQTPSQVLRDAHPPRTLRAKPSSDSSSLSDLVATVLTTHEREPHASPLSPLASPMLSPLPSTAHPRLVALPQDHAIVFVQMVYGTSLLLCIDSSGMLSTQRFGGKLAKVHHHHHHHSPFLNDLSASATKASGVFKSQGNSVLSPLAASPTLSATTPGTPIGSPLSSMSASAFVEPPPVVEYIEVQDRKCRKLASERQMTRTAAYQSLANTMAFLNSGTVLCTVGHHDCSARFYSSSDGTLLYRLLQHHAVVTCLATTRVGSTLALGSADGTISIWKVAHITSTLLDSLKLFRGAKSHSKPVLANDYAADQVLLGHSAPINCVAVSDDLGVCISGSMANECVAHNVDDGSIWRQFDVPGHMAPGVISVALSPVGHVLVQSMGTGAPVLYAFHVNGTLMAQKALGDRPMRSLSICARYSKVVLSNSERAVALSAHALDDDDVLLERASVGEIVSQALSPDETHVVFGVATGKIVSLPLLP